MLLACAVTTLLPYPVFPSSAQIPERDQGEQFKVCQTVTSLRTFLLSMHTLCKGLCRFPSCNAIVFVHVNIYPRSKPFIHYTCIVHSVRCIHRFRSASFFNYNQPETHSPRYTSPRNTHIGTMPTSSLKYTFMFLQYHAHKSATKVGATCKETQSLQLPFHMNRYTSPTCFHASLAH